MLFAKLIDTAGHLPARTLDNQALSEDFPDWHIDKIFAKTGIRQRHLAAENETALDLAAQAAGALFRKGTCDKDALDALIVCTQSPEYILPPDCCLLQERLGLPRRILAFDYSHGCSGYVYGLALAKSLIESGLAANVLLITAETYSRWMAPADRTVRTLFGDAATASFIQGVLADRPFLDAFAFETDGSGASNLIVPCALPDSEARLAPEIKDKVTADGMRGADNLYMNGPEIFSFTLDAAPRLCADVLQKAGLGVEDVDLFVFHQANKFMLDSLRMKCGLPEERFFLCLEDVGNTVSNTIPLALERARAEGRLRPGQKALLLGFGVGYSSAGCLLRL